jgi:Leucine-rich repeat (LRR) protein
MVWYGMVWYGRSLNSLNIGYNQLRSLPTEICLLNELKYLDLRFNQLPSLLAEVDISHPFLQPLSVLTCYDDIYDIW